MRGVMPSSNNQHFHVFPQTTSSIALIFSLVTRCTIFTSAGNEQNTKQLQCVSTKRRLYVMQHSHLRTWEPGESGGEDFA